MPCASHSQGETALVALVPISSSGRTRSQPSKLGEGANGGLQRCRLDSLQLCFDFQFELFFALGRDGRISAIFKNFG